MFINTLNPILLSLGPFTIRWYGLFLALGVLSAVLIYQKLFKEKKHDVALVFDLSIWLVVGGLIGARLGHIIFYNLDYFLANPLEIIMINHGGLASHGMTIGLLVTVLLYQKIKKIDLKKYLDILVIPIPLLASFIRIGNFFNSEIVGKPTDLPWGVYFPRVDGAEVIFRHPSQLYESAIALSIFFILYFVYKKRNNLQSSILNLQFSIFHLFLILYFSTRFLVEFVKEYPSVFGTPFTMGQILSIPFVVWGVGWFVVQYKKRKAQRS
jgi:prolipoprotein diacylglyceryl transferase